MVGGYLKSGMDTEQYGIVSHAGLNCKRISPLDVPLVASGVVAGRIHFVGGRVSDVVDGLQPKLQLTDVPVHTVLHGVLVHQHHRDGYIPVACTRSRVVIQIKSVLDV